MGLCLEAESKGGSDARKNEETASLLNKKFQTQVPISTTTPPAIEEPEKPQGKPVIRGASVSVQIDSQEKAPDDTQDFTKIPFEELDGQITPANMIAEGRFGEVFKAKWRGKYVAIKQMRYNDAKTVESFIKEVQFLSNCIHPNILTFYGANTSPPNLYLVSVLAEYGSLYKVLHERRMKLSWKERLSIIGQIAAGMLYLHTRIPLIIHRDLKSPNILLGKGLKVQVGDFGLSKAKEHTFVSTTTTAGSPAWMAPEILRGESFTHKSDIYSFAVVAWELLTGELPWSDADYNIAQIVGMVGFQGIRLPMPQSPADCPFELCTLIEQCWHADPNQRPDFEAIYQQLSPFCPAETVRATDCLIMSLNNPYLNTSLRSLPPMDVSSLQLGILAFDD